MKLGIAFRGCGGRGVADDLALCTAQKGGSSLWGGGERREGAWRLLLENYICVCVKKQHQFI